MIRIIDLNNMVGGGNKLLFVVTVKGDIGTDCIAIEILYSFVV